MANIMLEAALRYGEIGYPIFPCVPGGKEPLTEHGNCDATTDPDQIERWWTERPNANVGINTTGLLVLDLDASNTWLADKRDKLLELAVAPLSLTANGGRQYFFRQPADKAWRNTAGRLATKVDTRGDGGYVVVPPSVLAGRKPYRWVEGMALDEPPERLFEPPAWLVAQLDALATGTPTSPRDATGGGDANQIPSGQRNATLARLGGAMRRVGMSQSEIAAALNRVNEERCSPPLPPREVERVAASVARYAPDQVSVALAEDHYSQMYAAPAEDAPDTADPGPIPEELLSVPGFIDDVMNYTLETAPYPERSLAFCGALALQALLAGRKVRDAADNRTNLYVVGLANSGAGKDHPRKVNQRILVEAGIANCLGNSFASGEGIEDRLLTEPAALFQVDEVDGLLLRVNQAKDGRHEQIVNILLQMYSSANGVYVMRAKAGKDRMVIDQPCLCVFGTAVPKYFYEAISPRVMTNGFLARMLILESPRRGQGREVTVLPVPASIVETARWWAEFQPGDKPGNLSTWHPVPNLVEHTPEAGEVLWTCRERADQEYSQAEGRTDSVAMAIWARAYEKARRLALIYACSANHMSPQITVEAASWAQAFVEHQTRRMLFTAGCHASESDFDAKRKRMLDVLAKWQDQHGDRGMPFWMINRKLPWTTREHEEIRETLIAQRLLEVQVTSTGGRPATVYRMLGAGGARSTEEPAS
jgi:Bifunctional DNA primase/polymerase, N-terminal/Primase C terminal 1 (PriCT-1)/Protein of unknown function (DUF3987)